MLNKIFNAPTFFLTFILSAATMFCWVAPNQASQMSSLDNINNSMGIVIEKSSDSEDKYKTSNVPDLGADQSFPFIPGFGKNSGKD